jgi:hypothetical protein
MASHGGRGSARSAESRRGRPRPGPHVGRERRPSAAGHPRLAGAPTPVSPQATPPARARTWSISSSTEIVASERGAPEPRAALPFEVFQGAVAGARIPGADFRPAKERNLSGPGIGAKRLPSETRQAQSGWAPSAAAPGQRRPVEGSGVARERAAGERRTSSSGAPERRFGRAQGASPAAARPRFDPRARPGMEDTSAPLIARGEPRSAPPPCQT